MTLPPLWRKTLLLLHVVTSTGFTGAVAAFLALAVTGVTMREPGVYVGMKIITWAVIVPLAFASLLSGVLSSLATPWGLIRHYWVALKLGLTVVATAVLMLQMRTIDALAAGTANAEAPAAMILHASGGLTVLLLATALSIYKPRGLTGLTV